MSNLKIKAMQVTEITREEFKKMLADYGHHANVTVPVKVKVSDPDYFETEFRAVLNNAIVYNPYTGSRGKQIGMSNNVKNAETAMKFINEEVKVYSSVFTSANGHFKIID